MTDDDLDFIPKQRKKPVHREAILQKHVKLFVRDAVIPRHKFFAFDRTARKGFNHVREKAKGIQKATPDTLLRVAGFSPVWIELKWGREEPDDDQRRMGRELLELGDIWDWCRSVHAYYAILQRNGIPMRAHAEALAEGHDRSVLALIERAENKPPIKRSSVKVGPRYLMSVSKSHKLRRAGIL